MFGNVGTIDRIIRIVIGLVLIAYAIPFGLPNTGSNWIGWIGIALLITGIFGLSPMYKLFGLSTRSARPS